MGQSAEEKAKAEAIVSAWVWQPAEGHNYRFQYATRTLTRFYEAASMQPDEIKLVIDYLREQEISGAISLLNRTVDLGTGWKSKDVWYQTMPGEKFAGTDSTKIRIYQVLYLAADGLAGDGPYTVEEGCQYKVQHTFYWDVETLPSLPESKSGDEYTLQGLTRDKETGLYSCVIERKQRVQQDVAEYVTTQTAFETRKDEQHLGVKQENVNSTGKQASVSAGTIVKRQITKNADCTSSIQNDTIVEKPITGAVREYRKSLRGTMSRTLDRSQSQPLNGSGLTVGETRRSEETEGQLWNNEIQQTIGEGAGEIADSCARSQITHTDTRIENVAQKPTIEQQIPGVNEEVRKEARRTEENTWDVSTTRIVYTPKDTGTITAGTVSLRTETKIGINQPSIPVSGQGGINVVKRVSASPNDHGSYSTSEETTTYIPDSKTTTGGTTSQTETVVNGINQVSVPTATPAVNRREDVSVSINEHGSMSTQKRTIVYTPDSRTAQGGTTSQTETVVSGINQISVPTATPAVNRREDVSVSINEHGSMSTQKRTIVYTPDSRTAQGGTTSQTETIVSGINQVSVPTATPAVNRREDVSVSINEHGSMSTQKRTIVYTPDSRTAQGGTTSQTETVVSGINQVSVPTATPAVNRREDVSVSINEHGSMSTQKRTIVYTPDSRTAQGGTTSQTETIVSGINQVSVPTATPAVNRREDVSVSINEHGSMSTQKRTIVYKPASRKITWQDKTSKYTFESYRNQEAPKTPTGLNDSAGASFQHNDHGSFDGVVTTKNSVETPSQGETLVYHYGPVPVKAHKLYMKKGKIYRLTIEADCERYYGLLRLVQKKTSEGESMDPLISSCSAVGKTMAMGVKYTNMVPTSNEPYEPEE